MKPKQIWLDFYIYPVVFLLVYFPKISTAICTHFNSTCLMREDYRPGIVEETVESFSLSGPCGEWSGFDPGQCLNMPTRDAGHSYCTKGFPLSSRPWIAVTLIPCGLRPTCGRDNTFAIHNGEHTHLISDPIRTTAGWYCGKSLSSGDNPDCTLKGLCWYV